MLTPPREEEALPPLLSYDADETAVQMSPALFPAAPVLVRACVRACVWARCLLLWAHARCPQRRRRNSVGFMSPLALPSRRSDDSQQDRTSGGAKAAEARAAEDELEPWSLQVSEVDLLQAAAKETPVAVHESKPGRPPIGPVAPERDKRRPPSSSYAAKVRTPPSAQLHPVGPAAPLKPGVVLCELLDCPPGACVGRASLCVGPPRTVRPKCAEGGVPLVALSDTPALPLQPALDLLDRLPFKETIRLGVLYVARVRCPRHCRAGQAVRAVTHASPSSRASATSWTFSPTAAAPPCTSASSTPSAVWSHSAATTPST
jgi:hypothetical protein